jgi:hypothetical protein
MSKPYRINSDHFDSDRVTCQQCNKLSENLVEKIISPFGEALRQWISSTKRPFDSKRWKTDCGARYYIFQYAYRFLVGKTEDEVREWLGEPDWFGWEGVYRPKNYEEDLVAWNYVQSPGCEKHSGDSSKLHIKDGCLVGHSVAHHRSLVHFELPTIGAYSVDARTTYLVEAVISGSEIQRLYFPGTGIVDLTTSEIDSGGHGSGTDTKGRKWKFEGFEPNS